MWYFYCQLNYKQLLQLNNYWDVPHIAWVPNTCCSLILLFSLFYLLLWSAILMFSYDHFFRLTISTYDKHSAYFSTIRHDSALLTTYWKYLVIFSSVIQHVPARFGMSRLVSARLNMSQRDSRFSNKIQHLSTITQTEQAPNKKHQYIVSSSSTFYSANLLVRV